MTGDEERGCTRDQLEAYADRVGHGERLSADARTLEALHRAHVARIPFENLEIHLGRPMRIEADALFEDLVARRRGGYCFQMNELMARVLLAIGFRVERFAARVWQDDGSVPPLNHQLLRATSSNGARFLVDVGFGSSSPVAPIPWEPGRVDVQSIGDYRIEPDERFGTTLHHRDPSDAGAWEPLYSFATAPAFPVDFRSLNHAVSTLPDSFFVQKRVVTRAEHGLRQHIYAGVFTQIRGTERTTREVGPAEEARLYREVFGLDLPDDVHWLDTGSRA